MFNRSYEQPFGTMLTIRRRIASACVVRNSIPFLTGLQFYIYYLRAKQSINPASEFDRE